MYTCFQQRLGCFTPADILLLSQGLKGLEKESLRVNTRGCYATTPHPRALGSALTHPAITTDYSEALLELITPPFLHVEEVIQYLHEVHQFVYQYLEDEVLWLNSMPCVVYGDDNIPIANYGSSNLGLLKHIYRRGLGHRYGRIMQVIAGVHFNYSFAPALLARLHSFEKSSQSLSDFANDSYFRVLRNLQRFGWLLVYLFGASPALCRSFLNKPPSFQLDTLNHHTSYGHYATSLRMSDLGYQNRNADLIISSDSLQSYLDSLYTATHTSYPDYEKIGVKVDGQYKQLNAYVLQVENEYYSTVRPKQVTYPHEKASTALQQRGVGYIELRLLDLNPFEYMGVSAQQLHFLELFLTFCLLHESPPIDSTEQREIDHNAQAIATRGRDLGLTLLRQGRTIQMRHWASELFEQLQLLAKTVASTGNMQPLQAVAAYHSLIEQVENTLSAQAVAAITQHGSFFDFAMYQSQQSAAYFRQHPLAINRLQYFDELAQLSLQQQADLETASQMNFDEYLTRYLNQELSS